MPDNTASQAGRGRTVVAVHGLGADRRCFERQTPALLQANHRVMAFDLPAHGALIDQPAAPGDAMTALASVVDPQPAPVVLMGHSLGGYLSMAYALAHPVRISRLILVSTGPGFRNPSARAAYNARLVTLTAKLGMGPDAMNVVRQVDSAVIDGLSEITAPILQIIGENDCDYRAGADLIQRDARDVRTVVVPNAGHNPQRSHAEFVTAEILQFLAS